MFIKFDYFGLNIIFDSMISDLNDLIREETLFDVFELEPDKENDLLSTHLKKIDDKKRVEFFIKILEQNNNIKTKIKNIFKTIEDAETLVYFANKLKEGDITNKVHKYDFLKNNFLYDICNDSCLYQYLITNNKDLKAEILENIDDIINNIIEENNFTIFNSDINLFAKLLKNCLIDGEKIFYNATADLEHFEDSKYVNKFEKFKNKYGNDYSPKNMKNLIDFALKEDILLDLFPEPFEFVEELKSNNNLDIECFKKLITTYIKNISEYKIMTDILAFDKCELIGKYNNNYLYEIRL